MGARTSWDWDDDDPEGESDQADHARHRIRMLETQLAGDAPATDPALRDRLARQLSWWTHQLEALLIDEHFASGAGDRTLF